MPSRQTQYNMHASKGFSYLVPVTVQETLSKLLKQLLFATRSIYREYYGDYMASRECAADSSKAIIEFVTDSFPIIMPHHNQLAKLMNAEIVLDEHDGYDPILYPLAGDGSDDPEDSGRVVKAPEAKQSRATNTPDTIDANQMTVHDFEPGSPTSLLLSAPSSPAAQGESDGAHQTTSIKSSRDATDMGGASSSSAQNSHNRPITPPVSSSATPEVDLDPAIEEESEGEVRTYP
jgi:hypothetical protein